MPGFDLTQFLKSFGPVIAYAIVFGFVFAESGLLVGFLLPGDSLLLTAGLLASQGFLNLFILFPIIFVAAVLGDNVGYFFGHRVGPPIFNRPNSRFFRREHLLRAKAYYDRKGHITVTAARFMPYIRTFAPIVAGAVSMEYRVFVLYNLLGGLLWGIGVTLVGFLIGYFFGQVPGLDRYFTLLILVVMFVSALPAMIQVWKANRREILAWLKRRGTRRMSEGR